MFKKPMLKKTCERCGNTFNPHNAHEQLCPECKVIRRKEVVERYKMKKYPNRKPRTKCSEPCCVCGGGFSSHFQGKPYCNKHYQSMIHYGQPYGHQRERTNTYEINGNILTITTANGEKILADAEDYEKLHKYSWCISKTGYAVANIDGKVTKMHRYVLDLTDPKQNVDHKNHNTLDNRRVNMRVCTQLQNSKNRGANTGFENVGIRLLPTGKYNVRITNNRKGIHVGNYDTLEEARLARIEAERKYHGEYGYYDSVNSVK